MSRLSPERDFLSLGFFPLVACNGISVGTAAMVVTLHAVALGATPAEIGLIRGVESGGILAGVLLMGLLVDRLGARRVFLAGGLAGAAGYLAASGARSPSHLMLAVGAIGFFVSSRMASMNSIFLAQLGAIGAYKSGWFRASHSLGFAFVGPLLGAALVVRAGCPLAFYGVALLFLASVVLALVVLEAGTAAPRAEAPASWRSAWQEIRRDIGALLRDVRFVSSAATEGAITATMACFTTFAVVMLLKDHGLGAGAAAGLVAGHGGVFIAALFLLGRVLTRVGTRHCASASVLATLTALALLGAGRRLLPVVIGFVLLGVGLAMLTVLNYSSLSEIRAPRGTMAGLFGVFSVAGMALGPLVGGLVADAFGLRAVFLTLAPPFALLLSLRPAESQAPNTACAAGVALTRTDLKAETGSPLP